MSKLRKKLAERNRINVVSGCGAIPGMSRRRVQGVWQYIRPWNVFSRPITKRDNGRQFSN